MERKKYFIFEMMTKKILLCERWNDQKNTVNRSAFQKKYFCTTLPKMSKIFIVFFDFHGSNLKKIRLRRGAYAAGAPARRVNPRGERLGLGFRGLGSWFLRFKKNIFTSKISKIFNIVFLIFTGQANTS